MEEFDEKAMYVDKELNFIELEKWATLFEDFAYRLIARTPIGNIQVNTVWTGVNLPFGTPFETAVFRDNDVIQEERHISLEQAKDYHLTLVMGFINQGFLEYLQKENVCIPSHAPIVEQTLCAQFRTP